MRITDELRRDNRTYFLLSPKGTIARREWRSGYYHIARTLGAPLLAAGLDYEKRSIIVSTAISPDNTEETVKEFLYQKLGDIVPLFPEDEAMPIRKHSSRTIINKIRLSSICAVLLFSVYIIIS